MEFGRWLNKYRVEGNLGDMAYFGLAWPTLDADGLLSFWESTNDQAFYNNPKVDELLQEARSTVDQEKRRSEEHTSELQSLMRISYAVFCLKKQTTNTQRQVAHHDRRQADRHNT